MYLLLLSAKIQDGRRPTSWKILSGDISWTGHPIYFIFGSMVGFSGLADRLAPFAFRSNPRWRPWKTHVPQGSSIHGNTVFPWTPVSIVAVLLDHTMNTIFLSQVQWYIVLNDSIWTPFDSWNMIYHRKKAPQHLERRFCYKGKSTFGPFVLDQTMNTHFLSPLQWLILLLGFTW